ncbi:ras and EF-hand domain-containing protein-like isoform X1 [Sinocyclocheilus anshuiensis]|uniref:ras and EF-hand domain-containing protein-like isoform X1 n=1 Tax=Sinocyclocheilus anshuiensis TaxID=1608454 RepID=UPI0007B9B93F|nr:PREDICTED: ras and EF-hand domain-containing protein-like isoform X1 [Sinocyclocheilus anshuiensis]
MNQADLRRLFAACDGNKSGRVEYEDFTSVCRELNVPADEIRTLFNKFDLDGDGYINFNDFSASFQEVSEALNLALLGNSLQIQRSAWDEFENTLDGDVAFYLGRQWDELRELYEQIHSTSDELLLQQYEDLIKALVAESKEHRMESEQLETSLRRCEKHFQDSAGMLWTEELTSSQLAEMEEDLQQQLARTEERVREEEQKKLDESIAMLQIKHENELADLHTTIERLTKQYQEELKLNCPREGAIRLRAQISDLMQENEELRSSLMKAQINVSILQVELDRLKNAFTDQKLQHERESDDLKKMVMEYQSYSNQIEFLQEMNKTLYDGNDGLRSALSQDNASMKRRLSPKNEVPPRKMKPLRQSTMNQSGFTNEEDTMALVKFWADKYLDSGVSIQTETEPMSGSNYDSDDSHNSMATVNHSYSSIPSELEVSEQKSEALESVARSTVGSISSSVRRRLSAFPVKQIEDLHDTEDLAPVYRLVLAGDAGSGKSSFLLRLSLNEFRGDIQTTLGVDFQIKKMLVDGEKTNLQIWDTAGQERFRSIARSYFRKAHGVLLLYDVTSESSFLNVREWVQQIRESTDEDIPMCIIGNKVDLRAERPEGSCVSAFHGEKLAMAYNALFCEASAKEGTNVIEAVLHLAREVKKHAKLGRRSESQVKLSCPKRKKTLSSCCGV